MLDQTANACCINYAYGTGDSIWCGWTNADAIFPSHIWDDAHTSYNFAHSAQFNPENQQPHGPQPLPQGSGQFQANFVNQNGFYMPAVPQHMLMRFSKPCHMQLFMAALFGYSVDDPSDAA